MTFVADFIILINAYTTMNANQVDSSTPPNLDAHMLELYTARAVKMKTAKASFQLGTKKVQIFFENGYNPIKSQIRIVWTKFCDSTKLAGLHLIGGQRKVSIPMRLLLLIVWLTGLACSSYKCSYCLNVYLSKGVQTKITYDSMVNLQFPAITFCHINGFRKSVLGINKDLISLLSHVMVRRQEELPVVVKQVSNMTSQHLNRETLTFLTFHCFCALRVFQLLSCRTNGFAHGTMNRQIVKKKRPRT